MKRVVAYCRTAWAKQSDPLAGVSIQAEEISHYANRRQLVISEAYMDAGVGGMTLERPELQRLIADCRRGKIGTIITRDRERLSRDMGQLIALLHLFADAGVQVEFSAEKHSDKFLNLVLSAMAELESGS